MPNYHKTDATLFKNGYKTMEKHPDLNGTVKVTDDILRTLMAQRKAGAEPIIKLAGWNRTAKETGQPLDRVAKDTDRDYWMTVEEAVSYGIVSKVVYAADELA